MATIKKSLRNVISSNKVLREIEFQGSFVAALQLAGKESDGLHKESV